MKRKIISGERLAGELDVSRQALHKQIRLLRKSGYKIEGKPRSGYRLTKNPEILLPEQILSALQTKKIGKKIFHFNSIDSTQNKAKELANHSEPEGTMVVAERQIAGRGRFGSKWISSEGGIWVSLILRPQIAPQQVPLISLIVSLAISDAMEETCKVRCGLKWPNDIVISSKSNVRSLKTKTIKSSSECYKKVCGILTEMSAESERVHWVVLGFGINVNNNLPRHLHRQATTLKDIVGEKVDRVTLLQNILKKIESVYDQFLREGFSMLKNEYVQKSILKKGEPIFISDFSNKTEGKFSDIDEDGSMILLSKDNQPLRFLSGDITLKTKISRHAN